MSEFFNIEGLSQLEKALDELPEKIERNILRGALRAGAKVIEAEAKQLCPEAPPNITGVMQGGRYGELKRSIRVSAYRLKSGQMGASVKAGNNKAFYAHMVENGTAAHFIRPKNRKSLFIAGVFSEEIHHPGAQPKPFMRPALDTKAEAAVEATADYIRARLEKEAAKK